MAAALVDANVLIAGVSTRDSLHDRGSTILGSADNGDLPSLCVTNYVLSETLNYVSERGRQSQAVELYDRLNASAGVEFVRCTKADDEGAIERFRSSASLSFVDASIGAFAARTGIEYCYSFDDDLDQLDSVTRLQCAENPYVPD